jgi:hypothetical protein
MNACLTPWQEPGPPAPQGDVENGGVLSAVTGVHTPVHTSEPERARFAGAA